MEPIHERFRKLRTERGLTVKQLSQHIGVPESTYREWEYGRTLIGPPYVKLAEALSTPLSVLMTGEMSEAEWILEELKQIESQVASLKSKIAGRI